MKDNFFKQKLNDYSNLTCLSEQEWNENAVNLNGLVQFCLTIKNNAPMIKVSIDTYP